MTIPTVAVLDSNGIIGLAKADCFPLLQHLFTERFGIASVGAPHLIQLFAEGGFITAAKPHLDQMRLLGYGITQDGYEEILCRLGET